MYTSYVCRQCALWKAGQASERHSTCRLAVMSDAKATCTPEYLASPQSVLLPNGMLDVSQTLRALKKSWENYNIVNVQRQGCCHGDNVSRWLSPALHRSSDWRCQAGRRLAPCGVGIWPACCKSEMSHQRSPRSLFLSRSCIVRQSAFIDGRTLHRCFVGSSAKLS